MDGSGIVVHRTVKLPFLSILLMLHFQTSMISDSELTKKD